MEWNLAFEKFKQLPLDWNDWPKNIDSVDISKINLNKTLDLHDDNHIILFRHFIVYFLHMTLLQHQEHYFSGQNVPFRKCLEDILKLIKVTEHPVSNMPSLRT